jgi:hypothetical protein
VVADPGEIDYQSIVTALYVHNGGHRPALRRGAMTAKVISRRFGFVRFRRIGDMNS